MKIIKRMDIIQDKGDNYYRLRIKDKGFTISSRGFTSITGLIKVIKEDIALD